MYITVMSYLSFVTQDFHSELMQNKFAAVINQKLVYIWLKLVWVESTISTTNTPSFVKIQEVARNSSNFDQEMTHI